MSMRKGEHLLLGPIQNDAHCFGCEHYRIFYDSQYYCAYIEDEGHRRPCPPGKDCTVKSVKPGSNWTKAQREEGYCDHPNNRKNPNPDPRPEPKRKWACKVDRDEALRMYCSGMTHRQIAEHFGCNLSYIRALSADGAWTEIRNRIKKENNER